MEPAHLLPHKNKVKRIAVLGIILIVTHRAHNIAVHEGHGYLISSHSFIHWLISWFSYATWTLNPTCQTTTNLSQLLRYTTPRSRKRRDRCFRQNDFAGAWRHTPIMQHIATYTYLGSTVYQHFYRFESRLQHASSLRGLCRLTYLHIMSLFIQS